MPSREAPNLPQKLSKILPKPLPTELLMNRAVKRKEKTTPANRIREKVYELPSGMNYVMLCDVYSDIRIVDH